MEDDFRELHWHIFIMWLIYCVKDFSSLPPEQPLSLMIREIEEKYQELKDIQF